MLSLVITEPNVREFMNRLLREDIFDLFETRSVAITGLVRVDITNAPTEAARESRSYMAWSQMRPLVTAVIKNSGKPKQMRIVYAYAQIEEVSAYSNASALFLNMVYENNTVTFTTATVQKQFEMDKTLDAHWDEYISEYFKRAGINAAQRQ